MLRAREAGDFVELLLFNETGVPHLPPALSLGKYSYRDCFPRPLLYEFLQILLYSLVPLSI